MSTPHRLPAIIRDGLLATFDSRIAERLMSRPDLAETVAIAIGEARLRAGLSLTPRAAFAWGRLIAADLADTDGFAEPLPNFDLDAELRAIRDMARAVAARGGVL